MTQLSCDTPGAVPKSAVYIGESPSPIAAQAVMERSLLPCLVQASSSRPWPLPYQDWRIAPTDSHSCFPAACVINIGIRNPIWTQMDVRGVLSSFDGLIPSSKGCYCISKRLNCTRNDCFCGGPKRRVVWTLLFNTSRGTGSSSSWLWLRSVYRQKSRTGTRKSNKFRRSLFSLHFICTIIKCGIKCSSLFLLSAILFFRFLLSIH